MQQQLLLELASVGALAAADTLPAPAAAAANTWRGGMDNSGISYGCMSLRHPQVQQPVLLQLLLLLMPLLFGKGGWVAAASDTWGKSARGDCSSSCRIRRRSSSC